MAVTAANPRIILPHSDLESYRAIVADPSRFRQWVDEAIKRYPELFPRQIAGGYRLHDQRESRKMAGIRLRRIKLKVPDEQERPWVLTIAPSALLPYMTGESAEVDKALFLLRFGVPFWALAFVFGRNESYWYRQAAHFGRYSLVETLCKPGDQLPRRWQATRSSSPGTGSVLLPR